MHKRTCACARADKHTHAHSHPRTRTHVHLHPYKHARTHQTHALTPIISMHSIISKLTMQASENKCVICFLRIAHILSRAIFRDNYFVPARSGSAPTVSPHPLIPSPAAPLRRFVPPAISSQPPFRPTRRTRLCCRVAPSPAAVRRSCSTAAVSRSARMCTS